MTAKQRADVDTCSGVDPMAEVAADIAEADEKIRRARKAAAAARRAAGLADRYLAYTLVQWRDDNGVWRNAYRANLTIPRPTVASVEVLTELLLTSFHSVGRSYEVRAVAVAFDVDPVDPELWRSVLALNYIGPTGINQPV